MQIWAETGKSALPIHNYSQILYQFLTFTQNLKRSRGLTPGFLLTFKLYGLIYQLDAALVCDEHVPLHQISLYP